MASIQQFGRYTGPENIVTNNTLLLLGRIYQLDRLLFEEFLHRIIEGNELVVGPSFKQQEGAGGKGIPDAIIEQRSYKLIVETKLWDTNFWGKEEYCSHFKNEEARVLLTLSRDGMKDNRKQQIQDVLSQYDKETGAAGRTMLVDLKFSDLIATLRDALVNSRSRAQLEIEEMLEDFEGFAYDFELISDAGFKMHVFAISQSEGDNVEYTLYYNQAHRNERPHRFIGLYRDKHIKYIAEPKTVVIPTKQPNGEFTYEFIKGEEHFDQGMRDKLNWFFADEGWGFDGKLKFHLFDKLHETRFWKDSSGGIMGPRHFDLREHIPSFPTHYDAAWVAKELDNKSWE